MKETETSEERAIIKEGTVKITLRRENSQDFEYVYSYVTVDNNVETKIDNYSAKVIEDLQSEIADLKKVFQGLPVVKEYQSEIAELKADNERLYKDAKLFEGRVAKLKNEAETKEKK